MSKMTKQQRLEHANQLIAVIARHGRRFFYNQTRNATAHFKLDHRGRVWFIDDYSGQRIYTHRAGFQSRWRGFSHGGTLRDLVERMHDYIVSGQQLSSHWLGPERSYTEGNIWGYAQDAMDAVRREGAELPIIRPSASTTPQSQA